MTSVFIGGSRAVARLNAAVRERLDNIVNQGLTVLIGDAHGADKAVQKYLAAREYENVVVFCMEGRCRNNVGHWATRAVPAASPRRDFEYYATKDRKAAEEASYGFMLWDGKSRGSLSNVVNLLKEGKTVLVYFAPLRSFDTLHRLDELPRLLANCDPTAVRALEQRLGLGALLAPKGTALEFT